MKYAGDTHNFGQSVKRYKEMIFKPRPLFWEYLFLSKRSKLRIFLEKNEKINEISSAFELIPLLEFEFLDKKTSGLVSCFNLDVEEITQLTISEINNVAAFCALFFWFGVGDLHFENVIIGRDQSNKLICAPIDIECIFDNLINLQQTLLIESENVKLEKSGLSKILKIIQILDCESKSSFLIEFSKYINFLNINVNNIFEIVKLEIIGFDVPIRIIARNTSDYVSEILDSKTILDKKKSEITQIQRGDVPYFFRFINDHNIYYYTSEDTFSRADFNYEDFSIPSCVSFSNDEFKSIIKTRSAILSITSLSKFFKLDYFLNSIDVVNIEIGKLFNICISTNTYGVKIEKY